MQSASLSIELGRTPLWVSRIRNRLSIPVMEEYPETALIFMRKVRDLVNLGVSEERLATLWELERTLIRLLHLAPADDFLSMIAGCAAGADPERRLLLSNADLGVPLLARDLQPGLDFSTGRPRELFEAREMGEDALRVLGDYRSMLAGILKTVASESAVLRETLRWGKTLSGAS